MKPVRKFIQVVLCTGALLGAVALGDPAAATQATFVAPKAERSLLARLRAASLTLEAAQKKDAADQDLLAAARSDYSQLISALYAAGYYGGVISITADGREVADIAPLSPPKRINEITIAIDPGPQFRFSTARIAPLPDGLRLPPEFRTGEVAESEVIRVATDAAVDGWRDEGHAKTTVEDQRITANHRSNTLAAEITLRPGPQLRFGNLILKGKSSVQERRIRKIMGLPAGEVFSPDELNRATNRLRRTGVFRSVAVQEAEEIGPDNTLDIIATVVDNPPRRIGAGAELSSLDGLALSGFWLKRNLFGGAERFRIDGAVAGIGADSGEIDYSLSARLDRPATLSADTNGFLLAELEQVDQETYLERRGSFGLGFEHIFSDTLTGDIALTLNYSDVTDDNGQQNFFYLGLPIGMTLDKRNDILEPTRGYYLSGETTPFLGLNGTASGVHSTADLRGYIGFGPDRNRFVLAGRVQLGSVVDAGIDEVPPGVLFFSGGGGTVRGHPYQSLLIDSGGDTSGGRSFLGLSVELRAKVTEKIGVVGFFDSGRISESSLPGSGGVSHSGAGIGGRYYTGIGAIRFDVSTPVGGDTGEGVQFYVGIGQSF